MIESAEGAGRRAHERARRGGKANSADRTALFDRSHVRLVGTRSAMLLMREAYYGVTRFDEFVRRTGITEAVAAARLKELVEVGLIQRRPYREPGQRTRSEYALTSSGTDLLPALLGLLQWGDRHVAVHDGGPLVELTHEQCGAPVGVQVRCGAGHDVSIAEIEVRAAARAARPVDARTKRSPSPAAKIRS